MPSRSQRSCGSCSLGSALLGEWANRAQASPRESGDLGGQGASFSVEVASGEITLIPEPSAGDTFGHGDHGNGEYSTVLGFEAGIDQGVDEFNQGVLDSTESSGIGVGAVVEDDELRSVGGDVGEEGVEASADLVSWPTRLTGRFGEDLGQIGGDGVAEFVVEGLFGGEVLVEHGLGDPGAQCDLVHGGGGESALSEDFGGESDELGLSVMGRPACPSSRHLDLSHSCLSAGAHGSIVGGGVEWAGEALG